MSAFVALASRLRRTGLLLAFAALVLLVATALVAGRPGPAAAAGALPPTLTFEGSVGGGTIRITTTADRSAVVSAAVEGVVFPECGAGGSSGSAYLSPPAPVAGGDFAFVFSFIDSFLAFGFTFSGSFSGENTIEGTTTAEVLVFSGGFSCSSAPVPWTLSGPAETPPGPDDHPFIGTAGGGGFTIVTDPSGTQITALVLESVFFEPGPGVLPLCGEITAIVPLTPPVQISSVDSSFQISFSVGRGLTVNVSGKLANQVASGTLFLKSVACNGGGADWAAALKLTPTPMAPPPVGGVAFDPDLGALSLATPEPSGGNSRLPAGIAAAAGVVALAGAAWSARRRASR